MQLRMPRETPSPRSKTMRDAACLGQWQQPAKGCFTMLTWQCVECFSAPPPLVLGAAVTHSAT